MTINEIKEYLEEVNPNALLPDGFDDCIIGVGNQHGSSPVVIYSSQACIDSLFKKFMKDVEYSRGKTEDEIYFEALEFFDNNVKQAYCGENTPIFIDHMSYKYENQ